VPTLFSVAPSHLEGHHAKVEGHIKIFGAGILCSSIFKFRRHWIQFDIHARACPWLFIGGKTEGPKAESGRLGSWGGAATPSPPARGSQGSVVSSPSWVRGGAPTIQRFSTILSTQDDLSWVTCGLSCSHWRQDPRAPLRLPLHPRQLFIAHLAWWFLDILAKHHLSKTVKGSQISFADKISVSCVALYKFYQAKLSCEVCFVQSNRPFMHASFRANRTM